MVFFVISLIQFRKCDGRGHIKKADICSILSFSLLQPLILQLDIFLRRAPSFVLLSWSENPSFRVQNLMGVIRVPLFFARYISETRSYSVGLYEMPWTKKHLLSGILYSVTFFQKDKGEEPYEVPKKFSTERLKTKKEKLDCFCS